jgi:hypothetical protein
VIKLGHLYPTNISKYLIYKLYTNWYDKDKFNKGFSVSEELLDSPTPLIKEEVIQHFMKSIKRMELAIEIVRKDDSTIFKEDIIEQEKVIKLLTSLMESFGVSCADGLYLEEWALDMAIQECLAIWKEHGVLILNGFLKKRYFTETII